MIICQTCDSNARNDIEVDYCEKCYYQEGVNIMQVTIQRIEYREHTFDIPEGIKKGSDEYDEFINDYDWHDSPIYHADEVEVGCII